jgi:hypothetical protein
MWKSEYDVVGDHVGKTAFDVTAVRKPEKDKTVAGGSEGEEDMAKETAK